MKDKALDIDWITLFLALGIAVIGIFLIYSVGYNDNDPKPVFSFSQEHGKQIIFLCVGVVVGGGLMIVESKFYSSFGHIIYGATILLLLLVLLFGKEINGARSWFMLGPISLQPSEFAKLGTALSLAAFFNSNKIRMDRFSDLWKSMAIILLPVVLIVLQKDAGTALVYLGMFGVLYLMGMSQTFFIITLSIAFILILAIVSPPYLLTSLLLLIGSVLLLYQSKDNLIAYLSGLLVLFIATIGVHIYVPEYDLYLSIANGACFMFFLIRAYRSVDFNAIPNAVAFFVVTGVGVIQSVTHIFYSDAIIKPYQRDRILAWLLPSKYIGTDERYNVDKSELAIGSGGFFGQGYLEGNLTKLNFIPEQYTDFIFCSMGEQFGLLGSSTLVLLFGGLILRIFYLASRQQYKFSKVYAYAIGCIFFIHFIVNIGMTIGLVPTIGIPLPMVSAGGSSTLTFCMLIAVLLRLDMDRRELR